MYACVTWGRGPLSVVQLAPRKGKIKPKELKVRKSSILHRTLTWCHGPAYALACKLKTKNSGGFLLCHQLDTSGLSFLRRKLKNDFFFFFFPSERAKSWRDNNNYLLGKPNKIQVFQI
jgi:hypothetical protein